MEFKNSKVSHLWESVKECFDVGSKFKDNSLKLRFFRSTRTIFDLSSVTSSSKDAKPSIPPSKDDIFRYYNFSDDRVLGNGSYGNVRVATDKITGQKFAIKRILKAKTYEHFVQDEVRVMSYTDHENLIDFHRFYSDQRYWYILMELVKGLDLHQYLSYIGTPSKAKTACIMQQLSGAIQYLHHKGIVHGDIKPENILYSETKDGKVVIKLADFGSSYFTAEKNNKKCFTPIYSPPEVASGKSNSKKTSDVWAIGLVGFILFVGAHPFDTHGEFTDEELVKRIISGKPNLTKIW
eukprot:CAMPEP_0171457854 /NCGR_PEP_ID=MMETSP0945-20130129/3761_1 /TAXON_ID=109269 /ORGANISM="Vaucheria litorea, Strain CCMP2940" /LENGTH=293 /DNA_ID=CAMNT_0011983535 /DNA_START=141 /DNA_END=1019 /DNA_ORIENTATION=-